ncbi:hypothetical protein LU293_04385 [Moraxella nasovis]|uniref:hypothetical protein n=1 Tax=Moraxella nasovis TaxID=2904121 RepID=UPI001F622C8E|nr:hypothetical protein [Moraxella nasovis]UNU74141.1 hypothetical protein LU293_04385 [Moraxella nasovis]
MIQTHSTKIIQDYLQNKMRVSDIEVYVAPNASSNPFYFVKQGIKRKTRIQKMILRDLSIAFDFSNKDIVFLNQST